MRETIEHEKIIAFAWFDGVYNEKQARLSCELQSLNFKKVEYFYGELYHETEAASHGN
jgi:hypothetical protein